MKEQASGTRCSSPIHIHVDDVTPVHVHVKKGKRPDDASVARKSTAAAAEVTDPCYCSQQHKHTSHCKTRSRSPSVGVQCPSPCIPASGPWVPPPARTSRGQKYSWQTRSHRVEPNDPCSDLLGSRSRREEPDSDEEGRLHGKMRQYEKRIDTLMEQVAILKKEVEKSRKAPDSCNAADVSPSDVPLYERLLRNFEEVDCCSEAVAKQMHAMCCALQKKDDKRGCDPGIVAVALANHRQVLLDRMSALDTSCRRLKQLLREQHEQTECQQRVIEHRDQLLEQVAQLELAAKAAKRDLEAKDAQINELRKLCDLQTDEALGATELQGSLETSKTQLQKLLRQRDRDCAKMALELQNVSSQLNLERCEVEKLRSLLQEVQQKAKLDRKMLRKTSSRQQQSSVCGSAGVTDDQLDEDAHRPAASVDAATVISSLQTELSSLREYCDKLCRERNNVNSESAELRQRVSELETIIERMSEDSRHELSTATSRLQDKEKEIVEMCRENDRIQSALSTVECKLGQATTDRTMLQNKVCELQQTIDEYCSQITRTRREMDELNSRLEESRREINKLQMEKEAELGKVKKQFQLQLSELEPTPELLRGAEQRLVLATEQLEQFKQFHERDVRLVAELTAKADQQAQFESEKRDLLRRIADREEAVHQANLQVQEVMRDNSALKHRIEAMNADIQRRTDAEREKVSSRERAQRCQIADLETQSSQLRADMMRLKHDRDEAERKFNSQVYDLRDRLEHAQSTNRSLQSYVEFLKNSYTSCFAEFGTPPSAGAAAATSSYHRTATGFTPRTTF